MKYLHFDVQDRVVIHGDLKSKNGTISFWDEAKNHIQKLQALSTTLFSGCNSYTGMSQNRRYTHLPFLNEVRNCKECFLLKVCLPYLCSSTCGYVQQKALKACTVQGDRGTRLASCIFCYFVSKWMKRSIAEPLHVYIYTYIGLD